MSTPPPTAQPDPTPPPSYRPPADSPWAATAPPAEAPAAPWSAATGQPGQTPAASPWAASADGARAQSSPWAAQRRPQRERVTSRLRRVVEGLPDWEPLPPGETVVRRPGSTS
ncbi:hypothetical protein [Streptomyces sp. HUAS TT20]|uniref:hypothetical protein n=1 Tax=Streptomyces sp. HUAS TT20 TaxID=3447509 RepID=UPI0021D8C1A9|nr:hypothetical protein [Streptomyces sp. HUAS 15-9]UXY29616.1 hypothetical protein N8I87_25705 [Streptomyces sp. HUAS 15-9]